MDASTAETWNSPLGHCEFFEVDTDELDTSTLQTRPLSSAAKCRLLCFHHQPQHPQPEIDGTDAATLLSDLHRIAPSVAKNFVTKHSARDDVTFRLLSERHPGEPEEESYIAMSYISNNVNKDTPQKIVSPVGDLPFGWVRTVEQFPFPVSKAMFMGVLNERRPREGLWFDQVCVDQENEAEKAMSAGTMDLVYGNARLLVVALDDIAVAMEELEFLEWYVEQHVTTNLHLDPHHNLALKPPILQRYPLLRSFMERVLSSAWFGRASRLHDMYMARRHVFLVPCAIGDNENGLYTIIRFTEAFFAHILLLVQEVAGATPKQLQLRSLLHHLRRRSVEEMNTTLPHLSPRSEPDVRTVPSIIPTITEVFSLKADANLRLPGHLRRLDANRYRTSLVLNIAELPLALKPTSPFQRPTIEDECLRQLLLVGLAIRDPVTLCTTGTPLQLHDGSVSWLCKPTSLDLPAAYTSSPPPFPRTTSPIIQSSDGRAEYAQLDLLFLELPHRTDPNPTFSTYRNHARKLIDLCIQSQVTSHPLWALWQAPGHPRAPTMRNIFIQTLACLLDCGASWLLDLTSQPLFPPGSSPFTRQTLDALFNPHLPPHSYIQHPGASSLLANLLTTLSLLIAHGMPWASGATERTHGPLIVASPSDASPPHARHKALLFAPYRHSKTMLVAVPEAVKGGAYSALARGWILTSSVVYAPGAAAGVNWVLRGKSVMFGERGFNHALGVCGNGLARGQKVYGPEEGS